MKRIYKYLIAAACLFSANSCSDDFLDLVPGDQVTTGLFYSSRNEIRAATASLYGAPWFQYNDKFSWVAGDAMGGDLYQNWDQEGQFFFFTFNDGNAHLGDGWRGLFNVIAYANSIISDMPSIAGGHGVAAQVINEGLGEARFIRAYAYYLLAEYWEEVPIVENNAAIVAGKNLLLPKNTQASIYEFIRRDLVFAEQHLPASDAPGRVTKWSAKGMLAKLHLTMASHLGDSKSAENFTKAKQYAEEVITGSGLSLVANYANLFKIENNNNSETLFALQWIEGNWGTGNSRQAVFARNTIVTGGLEAWGGGKSVTYDYMQNLITNADGKQDLRRPAIYMQKGDYYPELNKKAGGYLYNIVTVAEDGSWIEGSAPLLNNLKKGIVGSFEDTGGKATANQATALNQYMLRLADVYLIYAEAALGSAASTTDAKALEYFNVIRKRAGLDDRSNLTFQTIFNERRVEFGIEAINWMDVKRWYYRNPSAALSYLNAQDRALTYERKSGNPDPNQWDSYQLSPPTSPVLVTMGDFKLPIPTNEVVNNPLLGPEAGAEEYVFGN
jgi:starch-binding outer membrane protein, SusD/RagB family